MTGRMYAVQKGIKLDSKSPEAKKFLFGLMDSLENVSIAKLNSNYLEISFRKLQ